MDDHRVVSINVKAGVCWVQTMVICQNVKKGKKDEVCVPGVRGSGLGVRGLWVCGLGVRGSWGF